MEFVEHDLRTLMEQRSIRFTAPEVKCLMRQLLEALEYLHAHFVLHRDLKTSNILLTSKGVLKVCLHMRMCAEARTVVTTSLL